MPTLEDFFKYVDRHKAELVVYRQINLFLQNTYLSTDAKDAEQVLTLDDGRAINEDVIEDVLQQMYRVHIAPGEQKVRELLDTELDATLQKLRAEKKETRKSDEEVTPIKKRKAKSK